ncbi:MAG: M48 family metallopeptidase [Stygiobacter sp.]
MKLKEFLLLSSNKMTTKTELQIGDLLIDVIYKDIKNIHLSVHPPTGRVRISAPHRVKLDTLRIFAISKLSWIKRQQNKISNQARETKREYITKESIYFLGRRYLLKVIEANAKSKVEISGNTITLFIRPNSSTETRERIIYKWYRQELKERLLPLVEKWQKFIKVEVKEIAIKRMKTRWGTCNTEAKRIWLNLELAKKPIECIEYIVVHEMVHLLERGHNARFKGYMDKYLPMWKVLKKQLNQLPLGHVDWDY